MFFVQQAVVTRTSVLNGGTRGKIEKATPKKKKSVRIRSASFYALTSDGEPSGRLAVARNEGHLSGVPGLAVFDGEGVLSEHTGHGDAGVLLQPLGVAGPVGVGAGLLQLHAEDDRVADGDHRPPGQLFCDITWKTRAHLKLQCV